MHLWKGGGINSALSNQMQYVQRTTNYFGTRVLETFWKWNYGCAESIGYTRIDYGNYSLSNKLFKLEENLWNLIDYVESRNLIINSRILVSSIKNLVSYFEFSPVYVINKKKHLK